LSTLRSWEREKNPTEHLPKKRHPPSPQQKHLPSPTTLPKHTQSKQASSTSTHNNECVHLSFLNQKFFYTHLKSKQYQAQGEKKTDQRESQAEKVSNSFSFSATFSRHRPPSFAPKTEEQQDCIKHSKRRRQATKTPCSWLLVELRNQRFRYG
jgi:hypothetical protein